MAVPPWLCTESNPPGKSFGCTYWESERSGLQKSAKPAFAADWPYQRNMAPPRVQEILL